jgi:hypothetical protein
MRRRRLRSVKQQFTHLLGQAQRVYRRPRSDVGDFKDFLTTGPSFELPEIERSSEPGRTIDL